jgi:hypothetical protein
VTDPIEMTHVVLVQVGELLRKLPPDLMQELYEGTATLEVVPKGGRPVKAVKKQAAPLAVDVAQVRTDLAKIDDRAAATRYVLDLGLTVPALRQLAKELGIAVASNARKDDVVAEIVQWTVGRRLSTSAIVGHASRG